MSAAELSNYKYAQVSKGPSAVWSPSLPRYIHQRRRFPPIKIKHGYGCVDGRGRAYAEVRYRLTFISVAAAREAASAPSSSN